MTTDVVLDEVDDGLRGRDAGPLEDRVGVARRSRPGGGAEVSDGADHVVKLHAERGPLRVDKVREERRG